MIGLAAQLRFTNILLASPADVDLSFNPGTGANSIVYSVALQTDGKILIGGSFTSINGTNRNRIARLNTDGSLDLSFSPGTGASATIYSIAVQPDGRIVLGGDFLSINGTNRSHIARLNGDGSLDSTFNPGSGASGGNSPIVRGVAVQTNGAILVVGGFSAINGTNWHNVARLNADGSLDTSFNPATAAGGSANTYIFSCAAQPDGKILLGGYLIAAYGTNFNHVMRLNSDGTFDDTFDGGGAATSATIHFIGAQTDGKVVVGGLFSSFHGTNWHEIARLNSNGSVDNAFNPGSGGNSYVFSIALQTDGKILLGGGFTSINGTNRTRIARLNGDGSLDSTFNPGSGANDWVESVAIQTDGRVLVGGDFTSIGGTNRNHIARLLGDPIVPVLLNIQTANNQMVLNWTDAGYSLQAARSLSDNFTNIDGATSPYTNAATDAQQYFRLRAN